jgi:hypothetical protein
VIVIGAVGARARRRREDARGAALKVSAQLDVPLGEGEVQPSIRRVPPGIGGHADDLGLEVRPVRISRRPRPPG